jgi:hypothetical protein
MSLGEIEQVAVGIYAYLQPDGSWYLNDTGFLVGPAGVISVDAASTVANLHRAYLELAGAERGTPVDLARALGDMVAYNGGHPLTCHA